MTWSGGFLPYYYCTVKLECYGGTEAHSGSDGRHKTHTCEKEGHSCMRKVVSYFHIYGRRQNRIFHRAAQQILMRVPGWESWTLRDAPAALREAERKLAYREEFRTRCAACGKKKPPGVTSTLDAGQAYEQTDLTAAVDALAWCCAYAWLHTGSLTVMVIQDQPGASHLGGTTLNILDLHARVIVLTFVEVLQMFSLIIGITFIRVGDLIMRAPGVTIGNPFGRIAIGALTGRQEVERDLSWAQGTPLEEDF